MNPVDVERVVLSGVGARWFDHLAPGIERGARVLAARWAPVELVAALDGPDPAVTGAGWRVVTQDWPQHCPGGGAGRAGEHRRAVVLVVLVRPVLAT